MSYILDALKKADRVRTRGEVPDLESAHWGVRRQARSQRWVWVLAALLVANAAILVILLGRDGPAERVADAEPARAAPPREAVPAPVPVARPPAPPKPAPQPAPPKPAAQPASPESPALQTAARPAATLRPKVAVQPHVAPKPAAETATPVARPRVQHAQQPLTETAVAQASSVPDWGELPLEFRSQFTLPRVDVHVYSEQPQRRFILVELKKYREGDTLASGAVLEEIRPDSIELSYQGTRFRVAR